jgi:hypothetical protein
VPAKIRSSLTYANVMATVAVFIALGGSSYAVATGSIDGREIKNNSVGTKDLLNNGVRGKDIRTGTVQGTDVAADALTGANVNETSLSKVPSAAAADRAASADRLGGKTAAQLTLACPTGTRLAAGLCFETTPRAAAPLSTASRTCALAARRLPDFGELDAYGQLFGVSSEEVTSNYYIEESDINNSYHFSYVALQRFTNGSGGSSATDTGTARPFRCVVPPSNG